jgi:flagellin
MSIVLSASVRQNLLSLQSTADLLATTQSRLSTGKKVNTALDNPTNFFTAQSLDSRASDVSNLLDGIGNGVQVLQSANTGITALQKLVDSAKSIANQALQAPTGYSTKAAVASTVVQGATADDIRGPVLPTNNTFLLVNSVFTAAAGGPAATKDTRLVFAAGTDSLTVTPTGSMHVNGKTITFDNTLTATSVTDFSGNVTISTSAGSTATIQDVLNAFDSITGTIVPSSVGSGIFAGKLLISTGTASNLTIGASATNAIFGFANTLSFASRGPPASALDTKTLTIGSTAGGTATNITFGTGPGQVKSLNDLNNALATNNLQASLSPTGVISIVTSNDAASATIGAIGGSATGVGNPFSNLTPSIPVKDPSSQTVRSNLVKQFNDVVSQINTTSRDASFNGINLLNGDDLKLTFNENGTSTLNIKGVTFNAAGLGVSALASGTDFLDNASANRALSVLGAATSTLRAEASTLGSNLSIVQIRQDFSKNLINVLQTGSSNLTLADTNAEAANSQALSTRQSIAVSALSLANQSQQSVLQLLR